jgi:hypothetical protein
VIAKNLCTEMYEKKIDSIFLIDRSARPGWVAIHEYWKIKYKERPCPTMYFINPEADRKGTIDDEKDARKMASYVLKDIMPQEELQQMIKEKALEARYGDDFKTIKKDFFVTYPRLVSKKNAPIAIFDTCAHSGTTVEVVSDILNLCGFTDVSIYLAAPPSEESRIRVAADVSVGRTTTICGIFGDRPGVEKSKKLLCTRLLDQDDLSDKRMEIRYAVKDRV